VVSATGTSADISISKSTVSLEGERGTSNRRHSR
jgi:hypothetical protein